MVNGKLGLCLTLAYACITCSLVKVDELPIFEDGWEFEGMGDGMVATAVICFGECDV